MHISVYVISVRSKPFSTCLDANSPPILDIFARAFGLMG